MDSESLGFVFLVCPALYLATEPDYPLGPGKLRRGTLAESKVCILRLVSILLSENQTCLRNPNLAWNPS